MSEMAGCCKCCSRWTLPALVWSFLSLTSAVLCALGLYFSNWLQRESSNGTYNSVSSFRLCVNESSQISISCDSYFTFNEIYSTEWQVVTLLMGLGACFLVFTALLSLFIFCVHKFFNKCVTSTIAVMQCLGVLLFIAAILLFPATMDNENVRHPDLCGPTAGSFKLGDCEIGWAYMVIIAGTAIGIVAVLMSWTPAKWKTKDSDRDSYTI